MILRLFPNRSQLLKDYFLQGLRYWFCPGNVCDFSLQIHCVRRLFCSANSCAVRRDRWLKLCSCYIGIRWNLPEFLEYFINKGELVSFHHIDLWMRNRRNWELIDNNWCCLKACIFFWEMWIWFWAFLQRWVFSLLFKAGLFCMRFIMCYFKKKVILRKFFHEYLPILAKLFGSRSGLTSADNTCRLTLCIQETPKWVLNILQAV